MARVYLVSVVLCALVPLPGFAQEPSAPPLVPAPSSPSSPGADPYDPQGASSQGDPYGGYEEDGEPEPPHLEPPQGELIPHRWEPSKGLRTTAPRLAIESLMGLGLGVVGLIPGSLYLLSFAFCDDCDTGAEPFLFALGLGAVGLTGGTALGVKVGGALMGGEGQFAPTLLGSLIGTVVGAFVAIPFGIAIEGAWIVPLLALPVTGAIIGYELSQPAASQSPAATGAPVSWAPVLRVRPSGGLVAGLAGRF
jgi:hypothetical protein